MALVSQPAILPGAFAAGGDKNTIPATNDGLSGLASIEKGFPPICQQPLASGGLPPQRADFNGIFNLFSQFLLYLQNGGVFAYNNGLDYQPPCLVADPDSNIIYQCLQQNGPNTSAGVQALTQESYWQAIVLPTDSVVSDVTESNGTVTVDKADGSSDTFDVVTSVNEISATSGNVDLNMKFYNSLAQLSLESSTVTFQDIANAMPLNSILVFNVASTPGSYYTPNLDIPVTNGTLIVQKGTDNIYNIVFRLIPNTSSNIIPVEYIGSYKPSTQTWIGWYATNTIVETYSNGYNWYRKYSDGWVEQGGFQSVADGGRTVTLLVPMKDKNYFAGAVDVYTSAYAYGTEIVNTTQLQIYGGNEGAGWRWWAEGYGA